jgi:chitodextrinase
MGNGRLGKAFAIACFVAFLGVTGCASGGDDNATGGDDSGSGDAGPPVDATAETGSDARPAHDSSPRADSTPPGDDGSPGDDAANDGTPGDDGAAGDAGPGDATTSDVTDASADVEDSTAPDVHDAGSPTDASDSGSPVDSGQPVDSGEASTPDTTPPSVPTGLSESGATTSTVSLTWTASTDPDSAVAGYNIYRNGAKVGTSASASYTDTGLTVATTYNYSVSAYDPTGNTSALSTPITASTSTDTTAPTVPTGLTKTGATTTTISLSWAASTDPDSPVAGYDVYRGGVKVGTSTTTSYTDMGLSVHTTYSYSVAAYDSVPNTSAQSTALSATTNSCSITVNTNTYDTSSDGFIKYTNSGTGPETNPTVTFTIPSGVTLDKTGCVQSNQATPAGVTIGTCAQSGTTVTYPFTGSVAGGASITLFYTTDHASEAAATNITVTATSCPP